MGGRSTMTPPMHGGMAEQSRDEVIAKLASLIAESPLIVEVRFGSVDAPPERHVFHRPDALTRFVTMLVGPGDLLRAWRFDEACPPERAVVSVDIHVSPVQHEE
jgi:hypothetical protein